MRYYDFSENSIRPNVKFRPQNDQLRADLPTCVTECGVMGSLGLFVPNYKKLDWTDFVLWHEKSWNFSMHYYRENFGVPKFQVYRRCSEMAFVWVNRYLNSRAYLWFRKKVTEGKMRNYDFSENPIRPHVNFRPQNDPLRADLPWWAPECRVMGSLGLFVPNYKKLDWTDFVLWPWEIMKFLHALL